MQGEYKNGGEANTAAEHMDKAFLRFVHAEEKMPLPCGKELRSGTGADGVCFIADMGEETAGFALLDLEVLKTGLKISAVQAVSVTVGLRSAVIFTGNTRKRYAI